MMRVNGRNIGASGGNGSPWQFEDATTGEVLAKYASAGVMAAHHAFLLDDRRKLLGVIRNLVAWAERMGGWDYFVWQEARMIADGAAKADRQRRLRQDAQALLQDPEWTSSTYHDAGACWELLQTVAQVVRERLAVPTGDVTPPQGHHGN